MDDYAVLKAELQAYNQEMLQRKYFVVLNKIDTEESKENIENFRKEFPEEEDRLFEVSALTGMGLPSLVSAIEKHFKNSQDI